MSANDELVSQFLAVTGISDTERAASYLEMSGFNLETAVGLFMEHQAGGGGNAGGGAASAAAAGLGSPEVRAPDATRTMRLMDDAGGHHGYMHLDAMMEDHHFSSAFAAPTFMMDARAAVNAASAAAESENDPTAAGGESKENAMKDSSDDDDDADNAARAAGGNSQLARLADMFAPPEHLIFKEGGFEGARNMAKDNKRWLLVNIQRDSEFSCHALNRDVWRDELVENLVREGFIFWQAMDLSAEGQVYTQRYHVHDYPHVAIIDPRTRRLMWKKEGWTQEKPLTAEIFAETAMDFCSRHSFDKPPVAPRPTSNGSGATIPSKRPMHEMSEDEQLQAAMRASLEEGNDGDGDDDEIVMEDDEDDEIEYMGTSGGDNGDDSKPEAAATAAAPPVEEKPASLMDELVAMSIGDEPAKGARIQVRMPDGKRTVRRFDVAGAVKTIYAFVAQSNDEAKGGREFVLMAGFPPKDLIDDIDNTIESCKLEGQAITVRWKS